MKIPFSLWFPLLPLLTLLFGAHVALASGVCQTDQKSLLVELKNTLKFNQSKSTKLVAWNYNADCCGWAGVTCDKGGLGHVTGLDLSNESISGGIDKSDAIFSLQYLQILDLSFNNFNTSFPAGFASLTRLISLNLSYAGFMGQIPIEISTMTKLVTLDLSMLYYRRVRSLKLEKPNLATLVQSLTQLRELRLDGVSISANGNEWCQALSSSLLNLQVLSLSNCFLSGPIDPSLAKLQSLSVISMGGNNLSAPVPEFFANFSNLRILLLSDCNLRGTFPPKVFQVSTLEILDLSYNQELRGYMPDHLQNASLKTLVLSYTNFSGTLPDSIGTFKNLSKIELETCNFSGLIPTSIANLTELVHLDFSSNIFSGPIPSLGRSKKLMYIDFSYNQLSGEISSTQWAGLLNLTYVDLRYNSLNGNIPSSLFAIPSLQKIQLSFNQFTGQFPNISGASSSSLDTLDLSSNKLEGHIPRWVFNISRLNVLLLSSNKFSGTIKLGWIQKLHKLTTLNLSHNKLTVIANFTLYSLPQMTTIKLASCNLRVFPDLRNQSKLVYLDLSDNQINGKVPRWIGEVGFDTLLYLNLSQNLLVSLPEPLSLPTSLAVLDLHNNVLQGNVPLPPPSVTYVDCSNNNFSSIPPNIGRNKFRGSIPDKFPSTCELKTLDLNGNLLEGKLPKSLANCTTLEVLDLGNNKMNDIFPCLLKNISSLQVLILRKNNFHGKIGCPKNHGPWPKLQIVDLASNNFGDNLPNRCLNTWEAMKRNGNETDGHLSFEALSLSGLYYQDSITVTIKGLQLELLKILTIFTSIDFSDNHFVGPIPDVIGNFNALYVLNLSHNALAGRIPPFLGNLSQLESLDLSVNQLSGTIPQELVGLTFLSFLNVSYNQLVGNIPTGNQFLTFENISFRGNKGLCGPQLSKSCSHTNSLAPAGQTIKKRNGVDWQFIVPGMGFGVGAAAVVAPLMLWKKLNKWYDDRTDKILMVLLPMLGLVYYTSNDWRIAAEEIFEEDSTDADYEESEDDLEGRFCVFCTRLDIMRKRAIHDLKCTCYHSPPLSSSSSCSSFSSVASQ
ncbi:receptor-like protein 7 isoform X2 [Hevea brasiliensis]|uniref:receptor-like protein 7 isoform X2 n=1 Tax=Hevea brasiliensis TaxID=3981 RepID=UPI0025E03CC9|nr:receptor-like protein 7 isoform X2 [Hevea brasiliensis]